MATFENIDRVQFPVPGSDAYYEQKAREEGRSYILPMDDIAISGVPRSVGNPTAKNSDDILGKYVAIHTSYGMIHRGKIVQTTPAAVFVKEVGLTKPILRTHIVDMRENYAQ